MCSTVWQWPTCSRSALQRAPRNSACASACSMEELLADPEIQIVVNLTTPQSHTPVNLAALEAGKNVYTEKPLAVAREDGAQVIAAGRRQRGCASAARRAPSWAAACRPAASSSMTAPSGSPVAASAFMMSHGHESWHPDPAYYYKLGAGPMFDMGPYYLTALTTLLGPVKRIAGTGGHPDRRAHHHQPAQVRRKDHRRDAGPRDRHCWSLPAAPSARSSPPLPPGTRSCRGSRSMAPRAP